MSSSTIDRRSSGSITARRASVTCSVVGIMGIECRRANLNSSGRSQSGYRHQIGGDRRLRRRRTRRSASSSIEMLKKAYWMEIETVMSYIANTINPDGVRAREVVENLEQDIQEELGHAQQFGSRIKELYGVVPGSLDFTARAELPPAAGRADRHRARDQGRDRGRERRDRALPADHRVLRRARPRHAGHGDRDPARRAAATGACSRASCASTRRKGERRAAVPPRAGIP